jgi:hypothetical protein
LIDIAVNLCDRVGELADSICEANDLSKIGSLVVDRPCKPFDPLEQLRRDELAHLT